MVRCLAIAAALLLATPATAQTCAAPSCFEAPVVAVADGDTVTVLRQTVQVSASGEDRYGRLLARLYVVDGDSLTGRDINREMVREGHAWVYRRYATENWLPDEAAARDSGLGLWSLGVGASVPPWEWRRGERRRKVAVIADVPSMNAESFSCGAKRTCREMASCAEARFHLETCGVRTLDGDSNGLPCEMLC